jgi:Zn-dependent M28 family amino/carboxypeptidase
MGFDTALADSGIPAASVSGDVAAVLFAGGRPLRDVQEEFDSGNPHVTGFPLLPTLTLQTSVVRETRTARNVLAYLPATGPVDAVDKPWIVVGAHYDHLGHGEQGNSLATGDETGRAHVGADDNASGTAAVLAIAERLSGQPRLRHVMLALWSAEEVGLVGSGAFASSPPVPVDRIAAYLNYDMVGRMTDNRLTIQAVGTSPIWPSILERVNVAAGFDVVLQPDPYQPTDVATFNLAGVPSLSFTTGAHMDYHKPSDTPDKINYEDLDRVAGMGAAIVARLMSAEEPPQFARVEQSAQTGTRAGIRVFTGTVPDYTSTDPGLLLGGVVAGGPAENAGLTKGDVIVEIAGHSIANIYDYTYALELLKVDEPVKVVYRRSGERRETMLTPGGRP